MPKYYYSCEKCDHVFRAYHGIKENLLDCPECKQANCLKKQINKVFIKSEDPKVVDHKVGEITRQAIEENREILRTNKKEAKSVIYEN
jgi:putative FmdB family regulatory protein